MEAKGSGVRRADQRPHLTIRGGTGVEDEAVGITKRASAVCYLPNTIGEDGLVSLRAYYIL